MKNRLISLARVAGCATLLSFFPLGAFAQYPNGIYAEFSTSMGSYTCRLEYALAPKTVANFIGLATGRAWLDETVGLVKTNPFYNGLIFHRVISNFVNQSGSPGGLPAGGPGYAIVDEFSPDLRHDSFGVLSMANAGPDSNGSQYFITVASRPDLNDRYSVFGRLYGGSNVVFAINRVATGVNDKPLTNIFVNSVTIQRIGAAALGFDLATNGLPIVTDLNAQLTRAGANLNLAFSNRLYANTRGYDSTNLTQWTQTKFGIETANPLLTNILFPPALPKQFFRLAQVQYASSTFAPKTIRSRTLTLAFTNNLTGVLTAALNATGGGTYTYPPNNPGTIDYYQWTQLPYNGIIQSLEFSDFWPMDLNLNFDSGTNGSVSGVYYYFYAFAVPTSGTFTLSP